MAGALHDAYSSIFLMTSLQDITGQCLGPAAIANVSLLPSLQLVAECEFRLEA